MRSHIWEFIPEGAKSHHIQSTIGDGVEGGRVRNPVDTIMRKSCPQAWLSCFHPFTCFTCKATAMSAESKKLKNWSQKYTFYKLCFGEVFLL